jgi:hypothetical protein
VDDDRQVWSDRTQRIVTWVVVAFVVLVTVLIVFAFTHLRG